MYSFAEQNHCCCSRFLYSPLTLNSPLVNFAPDGSRPLVSVTRNDYTLPHRPAKKPPNLRGSHQMIPKQLFPTPPKQFDGADGF